MNHGTGDFLPSVILTLLLKKHHRSRDQLRLTNMNTCHFSLHHLDNSTTGLTKVDKKDRLDSIL
jgi:hypothetical protein